jgi:hypothetical protein
MTVGEPETAANRNKDKLTGVLHTIKEWKVIVNNTSINSTSVNNTSVNTSFVDCVVKKRVIPDKNLTLIRWVNQTSNINHFT